MAKHLVQHSLPFGEEVVLPSISDGLDKRQIAELADHSVERVLQGGDVFRVAEALAAMEEFIKGIRKDERYVQFMRDELAKHGGRLVTQSGAKIEMCEAGVQYDYSQDASWREVTQQIEALTAEKKKIEENLRKIAPGRIAVDHETGEVFEGALKRSKSTYRITLKR
ncbi:MAG TPA: hypothetical protein VGB56_07870 [Flavisolibacter sp.]|jgi:hypothetical protein